MCFSLRLASFVLLLSGAASAPRVRAHEPDAAQRGDYLFSRAGSASISAATGVPYVGIVEASYGLGPDFSLGAMVGATPRVWGVGLRPRYAFVSTPRLRAFLVSPIFYYPVTNGPAAEPWVLAYPSVRFEVVSRSQLRFHAGAGLIAAACLNELLGDHHDHAAQHAHDHAVEAGEPMFGLWNTVLLGGALPLGTHQHLYAEASLVLAGVKTAPSTWIGGPPPFVVQVGTTWAF